MSALPSDALKAFDPISRTVERVGERDRPRGRVFATRIRAADLDCFFYLPAQIDPGRPPLICVHGISRNALEHVFAFKRYADEFGFAIMAPVFDTGAFRGYQTLGSKSGWNARRAFSAALDELPDLIGMGAPAANVFGFSGGGQFVHRYAMVEPHRINALAIASAGWYTFPVAAARFPMGLSGAKAPAFNISSFLKTPMLVMVGSADTDRDANVRQGRTIDTLQGRNRVERARNWTAAVNDAALLNALAAPATFAELPDAGHSFSDCVSAGLARRAVAFLTRQAPRAAGALSPE
jgi:poly(3-hydroxybutyrate) depolymerase